MKRQKMRRLEPCSGACFTTLRARRRGQLTPKERGHFSAFVRKKRLFCYCCRCRVFVERRSTELIDSGVRPCGFTAGKCRRLQICGEPETVRRTDPAEQRAATLSCTRSSRTILRSSWTEAHAARCSHPDAAPAKRKTPADQDKEEEKKRVGYACEGKRKTRREKRFFCADTKETPGGRTRSVRCCIAHASPCHAEVFVRKEGKEGRRLGVRVQPAHGGARSSVCAILNTSATEREKEHPMSPAEHTRAGPLKKHVKT